MYFEDRPTRYHAYMLRMWEERPESHQHRPAPAGRWRFHLEDPHTGRRRGFVDLVALLIYLQTVVARDEEIGPAPD